jgi:hypothetical protein
MKVVCIKVPPTNIVTSLKEGDFFETISSSNNSKSLYIVDLYNNIIPCDALDSQKYFITLEKFRENNLEKIGI